MTTVNTASGRTVIAHPNRLTVLRPDVPQLTLRADLTEDEARQIAQALWPDLDSQRKPWDVLREAEAVLRKSQWLRIADYCAELAASLERVAAQPEALSDLDRRALATANAVMRLRSPLTEAEWRNWLGETREEWRAVVRTVDDAVKPDPGPDRIELGDPEPPIGWTGVDETGWLWRHTAPSTWRYANGAGAGPQWRGSVVSQVPLVPQVPLVRATPEQIAAVDGAR